MMEIIDGDGGGPGVEDDGALELAGGHEKGLAEGGVRKDEGEVGLSEAFGEGGFGGGGLGEGDGREKKTQDGERGKEFHVVPPAILKDYTADV